MAIAFDVVATDAADWTSGTTHSSSSFTIANIANRVAFVTLFASSGDVISTVKWNTSETFTQGAKIQNPTNEWVYLYYLVNPTATTSTISLTSSSNPVHSRMVASVYNGATTPTQFTTQTAVAATSATDTLTVSANSWLVGSCGAQRDSTAGAGTIVRATPQSMALGDSNGALAGGSQSIVFNFSIVTQVSLWCELPVLASGPANLKSFDGNVKSNIKSISGNLIANIKSLDGNS